MSGPKKEMSQTDKQKWTGTKLKYKCTNKRIGKYTFDIYIYIYYI